MSQCYLIRKKNYFDNSMFIGYVVFVKFNESEMELAEYLNKIMLMKRHISSCAMYDYFNSYNAVAMFLKKFSSGFSTYNTFKQLLLRQLNRLETTLKSFEPLLYPTIELKYTKDGLTTSTSSSSDGTVLIRNINCNYELVKYIKSSMSIINIDGKAWNTCIKDVQRKLHFGVDVLPPDLLWPTTCLSYFRMYMKFASVEDSRTRIIFILQDPTFLAKLCNELLTIIED